MTTAHELIELDRAAREEERRQREAHPLWPRRYAILDAIREIEATWSTPADAVYAGPDVPPGTIWGLPVFIDPSLPPGTFRVRSRPLPPPMGHPVSDDDATTEETTP